MKERLKGNVPGIVSVCREVRQKQYAEMGRKSDRYKPGHDQRDANHPEDSTGVLSCSRARKAYGKKTCNCDQRSRQHRKRRGTPRESSRIHSAPPLFHLYRHHLDGDDGIVHEQPQCQDEST